MKIPINCALYPTLFPLKLRVGHTWCLFSIGKAQTGGEMAENCELLRSNFSTQKAAPATRSSRTGHNQLEETKEIS